jgi:hypothetical protein
MNKKPVRLPLDMVEVLGSLLMIGGLILVLEAIWNIMSPQDYHDLWFNIKRYAELIGAVAVFISGIYVKGTFFPAIDRVSTDYQIQDSYRLHS